MTFRLCLYVGNKQLQLLTLSHTETRAAEASPVTAVHVEQNDDESQAVTGQVGAAEESGKSAGAMLPSRHLTYEQAETAEGCFLYKSHILKLHMTKERARNRY